MVVQLVFLLLLCPLHTIAVEPILAKPGCDDRCGNVTVPYPFGVGTNCFTDEWFEIECKNSSKPFLKKLNLQVLLILQPYKDDPGFVQVLNPVLSSNCNRSNASSPGTPVNLTGSPFLFSFTRNSFAAAGCNSRVSIANTEPQFIGCTSPCNRDCCHFSIPSGLRVFNASFERAESCTYAFIARNNWFRPDSSCVAAVQDLEYTPAVLEWGIFNSSAEAGRLVEESKRNRKSVCVHSGTTIQYCFCIDGYHGTAYLPDSCEAIGYGAAGTLFSFSVCQTIKRLEKKKVIERKKKLFKRNGGLLLEQQVSSGQGNMETTKVFTSKELEIATDRFSEKRIVGQGGQGTVYRGMLPDGMAVAVKKSKIENNESTIVKQFINEVVILSQINHRNIVKLLGCCLETEVPLLVYEFVPNGTLSQYLHGQMEELVVPWGMRLQIANEVGGALAYLHSAASIPIYHRDVKSSNILLDDKYKAKVADFGISRSISIEQTHLSTVLNGTIGYLDPECFRSTRFTDKSDVFSFGVVLVELLTGQKAVFMLEDGGATNLAMHFTKKFEIGQLCDILDTRVAEHGGKHEVMEFANLAKRCVDARGRNRPTMAEVRIELERINKLHKASKNNGEAHDEDIECIPEMDPWEGINVECVSSPEVELRGGINNASSDNGAAQDEDVEYTSSPEVQAREGIDKLHNTAHTL